MKKKLLLTMGCSCTEGVGAYDMNFIEDMKRKHPEYNNITDHHMVYEDSKDRFHKYSWPSALQKKIKYDKLINMGRRSSSNSQQLKMFVEKFADTNFSEEYDVMVVWLLTHPSRISFYNNGQIETILNNFFADVEAYDNLSKALMTWIEDPHNDFLLEQLYEIRLMKLICKAYGYKFLFSSLSTYTNDFVTKVCPSLNENNIDYFYKNMIGYNGRPLKSFSNIQPPERDTNPEYYSTICFHPNERGYDYIAQNMFTVINKFFPSYVNDTEPVEYESIYDGHIMNWKEMIQRQV